MGMLTCVFVEIRLIWLNLKDSVNWNTKYTLAQWVMWGKSYLETNTYCSFVCVSFCLLLLSTNIRDKLKEQYWQVFLLSAPQLLKRSPVTFTLLISIIILLIAVNYETERYKLPLWLARKSGKQRDKAVRRVNLENCKHKRQPVFPLANKNCNLQHEPLQPQDFPFPCVQLLGKSCLFWAWCSQADTHAWMSFPWEMGCLESSVTGAGKEVLLQLPLQVPVTVFWGH